MKLTDLTFYTPPQNQGQIVEVSYARTSTKVIRRTWDRNDGKPSYAVSSPLVPDKGDYWNAPPKNKRWQHIITIIADE